MPGRQIINNTNVNPDTPKAASDRINSMTAELYDVQTPVNDSGSADAKVVALVSAPTAYYEDMHFSFKNAVANTGAATINVNGLGAIALKKNDGTDLSAGDLASGGVYEVIKKGTVFYVLNLGNAAGGGGGGLLSLLLAGKIFSGWIEYVSSTATTFTVRVGANTRIRIGSAVKGGMITLNAGDFVLDYVAVDPLTLYCDYNGNLFLGVFPNGNYIAIAQGAWGPYGMKTIIPTDHYFPPDALFDNPDNSTFVDLVEEWGFNGDGVTPNNTSIQYLGWKFTGANKIGREIDLRLKNGTYIMNSAELSLAGPHQRLVGESKEGTIIKSTTPDTPPILNIANAVNITFLDVRPGNYYGNEKIEFTNCKFQTNTTNSGAYLVYFVEPDTEYQSYRFINCDFVFGTIYSALWIHWATDVIVNGCTFTGDAWHNLRFQPSETKTIKRLEARNNLVVGGTTGIFTGSNRVQPIEGVVVENNILKWQKEESISFDGFGNNPGLCPTICSGTITAKSNDVNGRLVITADMLYHDGTNPNQPSPVSLRSDWTKFFFTLEDGSGRAGTVAKIFSFDSGANTFTLDLYTAASAIVIGGRCGVQAGFFNCVVRDNRVYGSVGATNNYANGLSIYLNVFGMIIENNFISGCAHAINLAGGLMLSTYHTLAYNNIVKNNTFVACNEVADAGDPDGGAVNFRSYYDVVKMYGNQFVNNTVVGGKMFFERQQGLIYEGNNISGVTQNKFKHCGNALPAADASQVGRRFMLITDDVNGDPTDIKYYVCKLVASVYSWVEI